ncbi:MAG: hypothetical protein IJP92_14195 [Lachnospiraceae bacterium]|nr:hypothetical protein [Lachnospiraceae bacterium]
MDITRTELEHLIDEYILNEKYRRIMKRRLCDAVKFEPLAEEVDMSVRQTKQIVYNCSEILFRNIEKPDNLK